MTHTSEAVIDPDPWTIIQTVIGIASVVGVFIQIYQSHAARVAIIEGNKRHSSEDRLASAIREAICHVDDLQRLLAKGEIEPADVLDRQFRYGTTIMLIRESDFGRYQLLFNNIVTSLSAVNDFVMLIVQWQPHRAKQIGLSLHHEINDFARRLNSFFCGEMTNSAVISECLVLLRTFDQVLSRLDGN